MIKTPINKRLCFCLLSVIVFNALSAQGLGIQIAPGLMNYAGDLQSKGYTFSDAHFSISAGLIYNVKKFTLRSAFTFGKVEASDADNQRNTQRNLSFQSNITDVTLCLQYDFLSLENRKFTPYVFGGVGIFHFNPYTYYDSQKVYLQPLSTEGQGLSIYPDKKEYSLSQFEVPLGIGFKYKLSDQIFLGVEFTSRFLFTDYLDDVSGAYPDENTLIKERGQLAADVTFRGDEVDPSLRYPAGKLRGNPKQNDNFYTSTFSFIYIFPKRNNITSGGFGSKRLRALNCPKVQ